MLASTGDYPTSRRLIMVVDDDPDLRDLMGVTLRDRGYQVIECANGLDALVRLRAPCKPEVIVLDLMMPIMDGWEFRVAQRRDPAMAAIPVVALSADTTSKAAAQSRGITYTRGITFSNTFIAIVGFKQPSC